ncbi:50S ribosomal protein L33 [bacterium]|jgi:ribosomal protein L33|nr:50S ribosomal protein L33 [bacterium]MBT6831663.1 50S ribosomal protein L33 [bacterium]MBT6996309.1 50S ribosomal protein L33 [bacterium]MBT7772987.1 50S ribosomal protein L33 [bacterium]
MARATKKRHFFALWCTECKERDDKRRENYKILINIQNQNPKEFELNKFCPFCRKHTTHKTKQISRAQNK